MITTRQEANHTGPSLFTPPRVSRVVYCSKPPRSLCPLVLLYCAHVQRSRPVKSSRHRTPTTVAAKCQTWTVLLSSRMWTHTLSPYCPHSASLHPGLHRSIQPASTKDHWPVFLLQNDQLGSNGIATVAKGSLRWAWPGQGPLDATLWKRASGR